MSTRRALLKSAALLAAVLAVPCLPEQPEAPDLRKVQRAGLILRSPSVSADTWTLIDFKDVKSGDLIRLFEPSGEPVQDEDTCFLCNGDAYLWNGQWTVETDVVETKAPFFYEHKSGSGIVTTGARASVRALEAASVSQHVSVACVPVPA